MLTDGQYKFLKKFQKACDESLEKDETCKSIGKKMVESKIMNSLLAKDDELLPNEPYLTKVEYNNFDPGSEWDIECIDEYIEKSGINDYIIREKDSSYYKSTYLVEKAIFEYDEYQEGKKRMKVNYILGIFTFIVALVTLLLTIIFKFI